ncbi:unnamed protein product [Cyprideis torosa]|uniref:Uncharacterized protein n=1 Tax=Cyprideis torosa TaxID=163714 RepID=A0A7R8WJQ9_9CRUS|nr:unnamed protein product [Cyprideis torosa]CAG0896015.1 unnamed protein product [Cyprideis torosa]
MAAFNVKLSASFAVLCIIVPVVTPQFQNFQQGRGQTDEARKAAFRRQGEQNMRELKGLIASGGWTVDVDDFISKVKVSSKFVPKYNRTVIRSTAIRKDVSATDVIEEGLKYPGDVVNYNQDTDFLKILETLDPKNRIIHAQVTPKGGFDIPSRESVSLQTWDYEGDAFYFAYSSVDYPVPLRDGIIRVTTYPSGTKIRPLKPSGVEITAIINIDAKPPGGVQQEVIDIFTKYKQVSFYEEFFNYIQRKYASKKAGRR